MSEHETVLPVLHLSHGLTLGGDPKFLFAAILEAISQCGNHDLAVLGIEVFDMVGGKYQCLGFSIYEIQRQGREWTEFVIANNAEAAHFVKQNPARGNQFYLMTAVNCSEMASRYGG